MFIGLVYNSVCSVQDHCRVKEGDICSVEVTAVNLIAVGGD